jgi:group II intron reverse transcriptase/maturase
VSGENDMENDGYNNLIEKVLDRNNLNEAYRRVKRNKGVAGIDGMTVDELGPYLKEHRQELKASIRTGKYKETPVKRVEIPKPDGSKRQLGIPTVKDRFVQQAVAQVLTPIYEKVFSDNSFGFRPQRSAADAIERARGYYESGLEVVVDIDMRKFFDEVNHDKLMYFIERQIKDKLVLRLIRRFLVSGIMDNDMFQASEKGTPQGGPLPPLLANIYLHEVDMELERRGHKFVRYADDMNIYVGSRRAGERVLESMTEFLEKKMKLQVNQEKSKVGSPRKLKFLGFTLARQSGGTVIRIHQTAKSRIIAKLKLMTKRSRGVSLDKILDEIRMSMRGWINYYGIAQIKGFLKDTDSWLRSRIRAYIWKQWKKPKTRIKSLIKLGATKDEAKRVGYSRKGYWRSVHTREVQSQLTNIRLEARGLLNLTRYFESMH